MEQFGSSLTLFLSLLVEAMPFLILGVLVSGLLLLFVDERKLIALFPKHPLLGLCQAASLVFCFPCVNVAMSLWPDG